MAAVHPLTTPRFFWQGALILVPLATLAAAAIWMLQRQRLIFEEEERQRAVEVCRLALPSTESALAARTIGSHPPLPETIGAGEPWQRFIASLGLQPPATPGLRQRAEEIDAAIDQAMRTKSATPLRAVEELLASDPELRTSAGLPAAPLVAYHKMRLAPPGEASRHAADFARWFHSHWPGPLSHRLLEQASAFVSEKGLEPIPALASAADQLRENQERLDLLQAHAAALQNVDHRLLTVPGNEPWLFLHGSIDADGTTRLGGANIRGTPWLQSFENLRPPLAEVQALPSLSLAPGLRLETLILGTALFPENDEPPAKILGTARSELLELRVVVADPGLFYQRLDQQTRLFTLLVIGAGIVGLLGFAASCHAFRKQHRLHEMKSNFVSSVSHELRAPIASVRLLAERLDANEVKDDATQHEYFGFIVQECRRLGSLIENVLDFARIEQDRKEYTFEETNIEELVRQTVALMQPAAGEKQIALETTLPPADPGHPGGRSGHIDGLEIQRALVNLIDNAIKYSPRESKIEIGLSLDPRNGVRDGDGDSFRLSVTDEGPGIAAEEQKRIFERFYRVGSELRRTTEGVGIGLSIVQHIVHGHHGRVELVSAPGKGASFILHLPLRPVT